MKFTIPDFDVAHSHWDAFHIFRTFSFDLLYLESLEMHDLWDNNEWNPKWDAKFQHKEHCFLGPMFWKFDDEQVHTWNGGNSGEKRSGLARPVEAPVISIKVSKYRMLVGKSRKSEYFCEMENHWLVFPEDFSSHQVTSRNPFLPHYNNYKNDILYGSVMMAFKEL